MALPVPETTTATTPTTTTTTSTSAAAEDVTLFGALDATGRYRRDTPLGAILHRGKVSFREVAENDSLHILVDGNRLSVHVDQICPLDCATEGPTRYSWHRVLAHNLSDVAAGLWRRVWGQHRRRHCQLECEVVWVDDDEAVIECQESS